MNLVNLTPHVISIQLADTKIEIAPSGVIARAQSTQAVVDHVNGIEIVQSKFAQIENLPPPQTDVLYVVSTLVAQAVASERNDVVAPDTGVTAVRDDQGKIVAVRRFQRF